MEMVRFSDEQPTQITVAPLGLPDINRQVKLPLTELSCALLASWPKYPKPPACRVKGSIRATQ
jgi:hypothetical protein